MRSDYPNPKSKDVTRKLEANIPDVHKYKSPQKYTSKQNSISHKKIFILT